MIGGYIGKPIGGIITVAAAATTTPPGGKLIDGILTRSKLTRGRLIAVGVEDCDHQLWQAGSGGLNSLQSGRHSIYPLCQL
jgi:hypothetical protein